MKMCFNKKEQPGRIKMSNNILASFEVNKSLKVRLIIELPYETLLCFHLYFSCHNPYFTHLVKPHFENSNKNTIHSK